MKSKIGRRGLLVLLVGGAVGGTSMAQAAEPKQVTVVGLAKSLLGLAEKAEKARLEEAGLIIVRAAAQVMGTRTTGRGLRKEDKDGTKM